MSPAGRGRLQEDTAGRANIHQSLKTSTLSGRATLVSPAGRRDPLRHAVTAAPWLLFGCFASPRVWRGFGGAGSCNAAACKPWGRVV